MPSKPFIETRSTAFRGVLSRHGGGDDSQRRLVQQFRIRHGLPLIEDWKPKGTVEAYVNEGRWVAQCPESWCRGAEMVDPNWPVFVCCDGCGAGPFTVKFPTQREGIEEALIARPAPMTRNWVPTESVGQLRKENKAHGVSK